MLCTLRIIKIISISNDCCCCCHHHGRIDQGLSNVQFVDLNSSRNLLILGFAIFFSLVIVCLFFFSLITILCACQLVVIVMLCNSNSVTNRHSEVHVPPAAMTTSCELIPARIINNIVHGRALGQVVSQWMEANANVISTGSPSVDQIISVLLSTSMFTAGLIGFVLDNTIPGTESIARLYLHYAAVCHRSVANGCHHHHHHDDE